VARATDEAKNSIYTALVDASFSADTVSVADATAVLGADVVSGLTADSDATTFTKAELAEALKGQAAAVMPDTLYSDAVESVKGSASVEAVENSKLVIENNAVNDAAYFMKASSGEMTVDTLKTAAEAKGYTLTESDLATATSLYADDGELTLVEVAKVLATNKATETAQSGETQKLSISGSSSQVQAILQHVADLQSQIATLNAQQPVSAPTADATPSSGAVKGAEADAGAVKAGEGNGDSDSDSSNMLYIIVAGVVIVALVVGVGAWLVMRKPSTNTQYQNQFSGASFENPMYDTGAMQKSPQLMASQPEPGMYDEPTMVMDDEGGAGATGGYMDVGAAPSAYATGAGLYDNSPGEDTYDNSPGEDTYDNSPGEDMYDEPAVADMQSATGYMDVGPNADADSADSDSEEDGV
jgi:hypothetical protein